MGKKLKKTWRVRDIPNVAIERNTDLSQDTTSSSKIKWSAIFVSITNPVLLMSLQTLQSAHLQGG